MTRALAGLRAEPLPLWQPALAATAIAVGLLAGVDPKLAVVATMGLAFVMLVLADITLGLCSFAVLAFIEILPKLSGATLTFAKVAGLILALAWLATAATRDRPEGGLMAASGGLVYVLALFLVWASISLLWAEEPRQAVEATFRYGLSFALFLIVYTAVRVERQAVWLVGAFVAGATLAAAYGIVAPPQATEADRLAGTVGEPNELAAVLVAGIALAVGLAAMAGSPPVRLAWMLGAAVCATGIFLSLSRAGLVALGCALIAGTLVGGRWRGWALVVAIVVATTTVTYFSAFAEPEARQRVTTIEGGSGRSDIWTIGWRMVEDRPILGVGAGNFPVASIHYLLEPGAVLRDEFIVDDPKVAHNVYLQVTAELGVVGGLMFVSILAFSLACCVRAARRFGARGDERMEILSRALVVALIGVLAADFFASEQFSKQLWLLLGLGPALLGIASRDSAPAAAE